MPSVDELLNVAEVIAAGLIETNDKIEIDADTRTMIIPETERIFGVMSDEKGERKYFRCKRFVRNGIDLSKLDLRVIYQNASGLESGRDKYVVTDLATDGEDYVTFSWELSRKVTAYKGIISFIVCAIKTGTDGIITNEWNTTIANGIVLEGLEANGTQEQEEAAKDYYNQLEAELLRAANEQKTEIEKKAQEVIETIPSDYTQMQKDVNNLKEDLIDKTKSLNYWNLVDISKVKEGYGYLNSIGYPPTLVAKDEFNAIDDVIPCKAGEIYTVNWLHGAIGIYDSDIKRIQHLYIDSIPKTFVVPDGGCYMTLFGGSLQMTNIMLIKGDALPEKYVPHDILDIKTREHANLFGVKWCAFGDSLTDKSTLASMIDKKNYVDYVSESLGLEVVNCGVDGTGYMKTENRFVNRVSTIPKDTKLLTVFGSFNDYEYIESSLGVFGDSGVNTIYGYMKSFFDSVFLRCSDIVVGVILPIKRGYLSPQKDSVASAKCDLYIKALTETAEYYNLPILDLYSGSNLRPWDDVFAERYYKDDDGNGVANTIHPLDSAHKKFIAPKVEAFIKQIYHVY